MRQGGLGDGAGGVADPSVAEADGTGAVEAGGGLASWPGRLDEAGDRLRPGRASRVMAAPDAPGLADPGDEHHRGHGGCGRAAPAPPGPAERGHEGLRRRRPAAAGCVPGPPPVPCGAITPRSAASIVARSA
ncbi:MAG TPA: hypothetical protein VGH88_04445 [Streptosporangiaceae bacterium]|jgi:hypothetical protein